MTRPDRDYDDILSRVLHSTLDPIEPAGDGLAKIQRRIAEPWLKRRMSLLRTELTALGWLIAVRCEPFFSAARSGLADITRPGGHRMRSALGVGTAAAAAGPGRHKSPADAGVRRWVGPTMSWLRPTLAVAGAVVIVVAGVFAMRGLNLALNTTANTTGNNSSHGTHGGSGPKGTGAGVPQSHGATAPGQSPGHSLSPKASGKAKTGESGTPVPNPTGSEPSASPSPTTPTPTPTPTTTSPSPSPSPTATVSSTAPSGGSTSGSAG